MATSTLTLHDAKAQVASLVDALAPQLVALSHEIHARPGLGYEEVHASGRLASALAGGGLEVEHPAFGIPTAFAAARAGAAGPEVVVCCEYDALPGIGHGCAHNVIAAMGFGAGLALARVVDGCGGRLLVLGSPAEERNGGGKIRLLDAGAFSTAAVAMMAHPEAGDVERVPYLRLSPERGGARPALRGTGAHPGLGRREHRHGRRVARGPVDPPGHRCVPRRHTWPQRGAGRPRRPPRRRQGRSPTGPRHWP